MASSSSSSVDTDAVSVMTLSVGPLLPVSGRKPASAAVSLTDHKAASACSGEDSAAVVVEGVGFAVVIVIAFAAFAIGVMLMSSLWFIYVKTSTSRHTSSLCFYHFLPV